MLLRSLVTTSNVQYMGKGTGSHVNSTSSHVKGGIGSRQGSSRESAISNEHQAISCQQVSPYRGCKGVLAGLENLFKAWFLMTLLLWLRMRERGAYATAAVAFSGATSHSHSAQTAAEQRKLRID